MYEPSTKEMLEIAEIWNNLSLGQQMEITQRFDFQSYGSIFYNTRVRNHLLSLRKKVKQSDKTKSLNRPKLIRRPL